MRTATKTYLGWELFRQGAPLVLGAVAGLGAWYLLGKRTGRGRASRALALGESGPLRGIGGTGKSERLDLTGERCAELEQEKKVDWAAFLVDEAIDESFPASDPPAWTPTRSRPPHEK